MPPLTKKKKESNERWDKKNLKRMSLAIPLELYDSLKSHVDSREETVNGFLKRAITETIDSDMKKENKP